jgi:hypothetical protein
MVKISLSLSELDVSVLSFHDSTTEKHGLHRYNLREVILICDFLSLLNLNLKLM